MRTTLPVTQREYQFPGTGTLLSTEELMGQPHNLVRHPDMPVEAFADMWRSPKEGRSWTARVKNRRINGDHYWVRASRLAFHRGLLVRPSVGWTP